MALFDYIEVFYNQRRRHSTLGRSVPRHLSVVTLHCSIINTSTRSDRFQVAYGDPTGGPEVIHIHFQMNLRTVPDDDREPRARSKAYH